MPRKQLPPPPPAESTALAVTPPVAAGDAAAAHAAAAKKVQADALSKMVEVQQNIATLTIQLLDDSLPVRELRAITTRLHRQRVAALLLREIAYDSADPTTYRELALLNKMTDGDEINTEDADALDAEASERLNEVGIDPESAGTMVRMLKSLQHAMMNTPNGRSRAADPDADPDADTPQP